MIAARSVMVAVHADDAVHDLGQRLGLRPGVAGIEHHQPEVSLVAGTQHVHKGRSAYRLRSALARLAHPPVARGQSDFMSRPGTDLVVVPQPIRGLVVLTLPGLQEDLVGAAVAAEVDDLGLALVELAQQIDRPGSGNQDQLHRIAKRAETDLLVDLPELAGEIERRCSPGVRGEEQDLDHLGPDLPRKDAKGGVSDSE